MTVQRASNGWKVIAANGVTLARFKGRGSKRRALMFMRDRAKARKG